MPGYAVYTRPGSIKRLDSCAKCEKPRRCIRRLECAIEADKAVRKAEKLAVKKAKAEIEEGLFNAGV